MFWQEWIHADCDQNCSPRVTQNECQLHFAVQFHKSPPGISITISWIFIHVTVTKNYREGTYKVICAWVSEQWFCDLRTKYSFFFFLWKRNNRGIIQFSRLCHRRFICKILASITFFSLNYSKCIRSKLSNKHIGRSIRLLIKYFFFSFLSSPSACLHLEKEAGRGMWKLLFNSYQYRWFYRHHKKMYKKKLFKANKWF